MGGLTLTLSSDSSSSSDCYHPSAKTAWRAPGKLPPGPAKIGWRDYVWSVDLSQRTGSRDQTGIRVSHGATPSDDSVVRGAGSGAGTISTGRLDTSHPRPASAAACPRSLTSELCRRLRASGSPGSARDPARRRTNDAHASRRGTRAPVSRARRDRVHLRAHVTQ